MIRSQLSLLLVICWICGCSSEKMPSNQYGTSKTNTHELSIDLRRKLHLGRKGGIFSRFDIPPGESSPATLNDFVEMLQQDFDRWHSSQAGYGRSLALSGVSMDWDDRSTKQTQLWQACKESLLESPTHTQIAETLIAFHAEIETSLLGPPLDGVFPTYVRAAFSDNESLSMACSRVLTHLSPGWDDWLPSSNEVSKRLIIIDELGRRIDELSSEGKTPPFNLSNEQLTLKISLAPNDSGLYYARGLTYFLMDRYDDSIADYSEAIRLGYDDNSQDDTVLPGSAVNGRGLAWAGKGEYQKAIHDYDEAIRIDENNAAAFYNRGLAYKSLSKIDKAISDFSNAIRLGLGEPDVFLNRGNAWQAMGDLSKAIVDYNESIRLGTSSSCSRCQFSSSLQRANHP